MLTRTEIEQVAQAVNAYRPDWPVASLCSFLRRHENRPLRDVALELTYVALDPSSKTPARIESDGPWKQITRPLGAAPVSYRTIQPDDCAICSLPQQAVHVEHTYEPRHARSSSALPTDEQRAALEAARIEAEQKLTAAREPEPTREVRDAAEVVASHLTEEKAS